MKKNRKKITGAGKRKRSASPSFPYKKKKIASAHSPSLTPIRRQSQQSTPSPSPLLSPLLTPMQTPPRLEYHVPVYTQHQSFRQYPINERERRELSAQQRERLQELANVLRNVDLYESSSSEENLQNLQ